MVVNALRCSVAGRVLLGLTPVIWLSGCSGGTDAGTVAVEGIVTLDDKAIAEASVGFIGREGATLASATTDTNGRFKLRAALGKNVVTVAKAPPGGAAPPPSDEPALMPSEGQYAQMLKAAAPSEVPAKYGDPKTSGISFEIVAGMQSIALALSSK
jgi:hypothetical protein